MIIMILHMRDNHHYTYIYMVYDLSNAVASDSSNGYLSTENNDIWW